MTAAEKRAVEKVVGERLKDPYSARFKHPVFDMPKGSGGTIYCGYVNSKNSYGGYAGDALFMVGFFTEVVKGKPVTTAKLIEMGTSEPDDAESEVMRQACRDKPVP